MKKVGLKLIAGTLSLILVFASFLGINAKSNKELKPGTYDPKENATVVAKMDDPAGLVKVQPLVTPTDSYYNTQKNYSHSSSLLGNIEGTWDAYTGKGTTIAIIDDGFDYQHSEYTRSDGSSAILSTSRYYYYSNGYVYNKSYSSDPTCIQEDWAYQSSTEKYAWDTHGTNTSTTAAAPMNNGGGVGIAPEADILAIKVDMNLASIYYAIDYAVSQGVDVINMSIGAYAETFTDGFGNQQTGTASTATYLDAKCELAYNNGIIVVAAAGNHATYHKSYPACNYKVIGVGALAQNNASTLASFTNYVSTSQSGELNVDIMAPGYVYTAGRSGTESSPTHSYFSTQGTSFSSPIVAGAACLWKQKYPNGTPDQFLSQLQSTASGIGNYENLNIRSGVGPSNITQGRLNVGNLLAVDSPFVSLKKSSYSLLTGETEQIQLDTYNGDISYSSSNTSVATVTNAGLIRGVGSGSATITVTATKNGNTFPVNASVTVSSGIKPTSISFNPASISLEIGDTYNAEETIVTVPSNASRLFLYESDNESVFTVDENGIITAVGAGDAELMVLGENDTEAYLSVSVAAQEGPTSWEKVSTISDGDYLIVYETGGLAFNGGLTTLDAASNTISVSISNDKIPYNSTTEAAKFTITTMSGGYSIKAANGKYISGTSGSNILNAGDVAFANTITISNGDADIVSNTSHLRYNSDSTQARFRYFKSSSYSSQKAIQLYKATSGGTPAPTVSSVTVSPSTLSLDVYNNKTGVLTATVNGTNNPSQAVNWSTGNGSVATVSNGTVTAVGAGTTTITATSVADGTKSGSCTVTVTDSTPVTLSSISVKTAPTKLSYEVGDNFDPTGLVITRHYSNSSSSDYTYANHTSEFSFNPSLETALTTSDTSVTITYGGKSTTQSITVTSSGGGGGDVEPTSVTYTAQTTSSATITSGTAPSGSSVTFSNTYTNAQQMTKDKRQTWTWSGYSGYTLTSIKANMKRNSSTGTGTLSLTNNSVSVSLGKSISSTSDLTSSYVDYELLSSSFKCNGNMVLTITSTQNSIYCSYITLTYEKKDTSDKVLSSLTASYSGGNIYVGDSLDISKVSVTANFTDSSKYPAETLTSSDYSLSTLDSSTAGTKAITVTYTGSITTLTPTVTTSFNVTVVADTVSNVSVSNTKTYHPGETIAKSDIIVTLSWASGRADTTTTDFTFANDGYMFTYSDAPSGGTTGSKQFSITYGNNSYNFSVNVSRVSYTPIVGATDTLTRATTGITGTSYTSWSGKNGTSGSVYAGQSAGGNDAIQIRSSGSDSGVIMTASGGKIAKVTVVWQSSTSEGRTLNVYGKNSAYSAPSELFNSSTQGTLLGTIVKGTSTELTITGDYEYIGLRSASSPMYLTSITIQFAGGQDNPNNVSNYIMYEDNVNQCKTKLSAALEKLNSMSNADKNTFMTSTDYVIATARERITAWARHEGKTFSLTNNTFVVNTANISPIVNNVTNNSTMLLIVVFTSITLISIGGYFFIRRKHE